MKLERELKVIEGGGSDRDVFKGQTGAPCCSELRTYYACCGWMLCCYVMFVCKQCKVGVVDVPLQRLTRNCSLCTSRNCPKYVAKMSLAHPSNMLFGIVLQWGV